MKQKTIINALIILVTSAILLALWFNGLSWLYAKLLSAGANIVLVFSSSTSVGVKIDHNVTNFLVTTLIDGRKGTYPQKADIIMLPFIMILTWQILLLFNLPLKKALRSMAENLIIFYIFQLIFLLLLTGYYNSALVKFIYELLLDSFYIIALFLIVKDAFKYKLIKRFQSK
jgi:hypothetical protein